MTPTEAAIGEYKKTILDLQDRLSNLAALFADTLAKKDKEISELKKEKH